MFRLESGGNRSKSISQDDVEKSRQMMVRSPLQAQRVAKCLCRSNDGREMLYLNRTAVD